MSSPALRRNPTRRWVRQGAPRLALLAALCCLVAACRAIPAPPATPQVLGATPSPCRGVLLLESAPAGAQAWLGGELVGQTPTRLELAPGIHQITLEREGYARHRIVVTLACGETVRLAPTLRDIAAPTIAVEPLPAQVGPTDGLKIVAHANDNEGIAFLGLYVDDALLQGVSEPALRHNVDTRALAVGVHQGRVVARDAAGNEATAPFQFEIVAPTTIAPSPAPIASATPRPTATLVPTPSATPTATPTPTPTPRPTVVAYQGQITLAVYDYERALYTDPEGAGHPYPLLDHDRVGPPVNRTFQTLVLRNEYLEVIVLPELGGRIYQLRYLPTGQPLLYNSRVAKPTRWGPVDQGWWLALGGIEFALPVDEHGYLTALPWEASLTRGADGSATVSLQILEQTRQLDTRVEITLRPREAAIRLRTSLRNRSELPQAFQYWINAMLSPGGHGVGPNLRFTLPTDTVLVHSTGDSALPLPGETMPWPWAAGRDLSRYGNWRNWLGIFAPRLSAPFVAAYDEAAQIGIVHAFPPIMQGAKLFGFGRDFDHSAYADDGAQYVELWGGLTPSFWQYTALGAGEAVAWEEVWYVVAQGGGIDFANADASLYATRQGDRLQLTIASPGEHRWRLVVSQGESNLLEQWFAVRPDAPHRVDVGLGNATGQVDVHILESDDSTVLRRALAP